MRRPRVALTTLRASVLLAAAVAGCSHEPATRFGPGPIQRETAVLVVDGAGTPVPGATVLAVSADLVQAFSGTTDAGGLAHFTLTEGRWAVSTHVTPGSGPPLAAGSTGRILGAGSGIPDTAMFRLRLGIQSVATGTFQLAGRANHSGTLVSVVELLSETNTDSTGAWRLTGLPPGVWTGLAENPGFKIAVFDLPVPGVDDTITVASQVLQPGGLPGPRR